MKNDAVINLRVNSRDKAFLTETAKIERKSLSAYLRDCAEKEANRVLKALNTDKQHC